MSRSPGAGRHSSGSTLTVLRSALLALASPRRRVAFATGALATPSPPGLTSTLTSYASTESLLTRPGRGLRGRSSTRRRGACSGGSTRRAGRSVLTLWSAWSARCVGLRSAGSKRRRGKRTKGKGRNSSPRASSGPSSTGLRDYRSTAESLRRLERLRGPKLKLQTGPSPSPPRDLPHCAALALALPPQASLTFRLESQRRSPQSYRPHLPRF
mmetsp:Transcript_8614/g.17271  ORF Transcript_8614/g.17271 Transcript_8614/m.17271 type:complete len:213 (-) Transcript_8614:662-1300(-)